MNYVFFDIECANCLHGEGKICSFGYVKTDENFQVLKKKDILVDPAAPFLLGNAKTGNGIRLAYPLFRFKWAHTFPFYYQEIKTLLEDKDSLAFGFAVKQDVSYLLFSARRYQLNPIRFRFYDIQLFEKELHKRKNPSGLDTLIEFYHQDKFTYHRSDDDALMTMEVFKSLLKENSFTARDVLQKYPDGLSDTQSLLTDLENRKAKKRKKEDIKKKEDSLFLFFSKEEAPLQSADLSLYKKKIFITKDILIENLSTLLAGKNKIRKKGARIVRSPEEADILVLAFDDKDSPFFSHVKKDAKKMSIDELLGKFGIAKEKPSK
ncbi:MAG: 3'-5' exonuclease [Bacilli bacterium]